MPFGIDPKEVAQVIEDVAAIKARQLNMEAALIAIVDTLTSLKQALNDHGPQPNQMEGTLPRA